MSLMSRDIMPKQAMDGGIVLHCRPLFFIRHLLACADDPAKFRFACARTNSCTPLGKHKTVFLGMMAVRTGSCL